jgi:hypothetical protein
LGTTIWKNSVFSQTLLNFFVSRYTNALAESFNAKIKAFRASLRGVSDIIKGRVPYLIIYDYPQSDLLKKSTQPFIELNTGGISVTFFIESIHVSLSERK